MNTNTLTLREPFLLRVPLNKEPQRNDDDAEGKHTPEGNESDDRDKMSGAGNPGGSSHAVALGDNLVKIMCLDKCCLTACILYGIFQQLYTSLRTAGAATGDVLWFVAAEVWMLFD